MYPGVCKVGVYQDVHTSGGVYTGYSSQGCIPGYTSQGGLFLPVLLLGREVDNEARSIPLSLVNRDNVA